MLEVNNVCVSFRSERQEKLFGITRDQVLFDVSLKVPQGTCLGILGESGSGKSTLGRVISGLLKPDSGELKIHDTSVYASRSGRKNLQKRLSVVFQDYTTSANPRFRVKEIIAEGLSARERNQKVRLNRAEETSRLLELVGLNASYADRYPMSCPADSCSVSALPGPWHASRRSSSLTKPSPPWMPTPRSRSWTFCVN